MSHIFISYSRRDLAFAQKIVDELAENKLDVWVDWKSIPEGEDWEQEIYLGIEESDAFLFLISPGSVVSEMCNKEIAHAVKNGKRILPIFIASVDNDGVYGVTEQFLHWEQKEEINRRNFIFCREGREEFNATINEIQTTIHTDYEWLKYHTKLLIKALDWKRHGDQSRLLRGRELREAEQLLADAGTENDPHVTDLQCRFVVASRKDENRRIVRTRIFGAVLTLAVILASIAGSILFDRTPAKVNVDGQIFEIRNRFNYRFLSIDVGSTISVQADPQKLKPNGEYLFIVGTASDGERPGTVLAYDMTGKIVWKYTVDYDPYLGPPGNFKIRKIILDDILGNGQFQILFTAQKSDWFPTELVLLDSEGKLLGYYWNSGFIYDVLQQDFDGDGIKELVVSAVNNNLGYLVVNDETKHPVTVYVLSPSQDFTGQAFPDLIPDLASGTEYNHWIAVFEPYVVGGIELRITEEDGENLIEVVFNPQGGYIWMDSFGRIQRTGLSDYWQTQQAGRSPVEFICFLKHEGEDWYISGRTDEAMDCPWYVSE